MGKEEWEDKKWMEDLAQAYQDNAELDAKMAEELMDVSYEVDQIMEKEMNKCQERS